MSRTPPAAIAALSVSCSNHSSTRSCTDMGRTRRSSVMSSRPNERNLRPSPRSGAISPNDNPASRSGGGSWYSDSRNPARARRRATNAGQRPASLAERRRILSAAPRGLQDSTSGSLAPVAIVTPTAGSVSTRSPMPIPIPRATAGGSHPVSRPSGDARNPG
jgi:hypothetical protein